MVGGGETQSSDVASSVTLVFTDIEGSTRLLSSVGDEAYRRLLSLHTSLLRSTFETAGGEVLGSRGNSLFAVFTESAADAVRAAVMCQRSLADHPWPGGCEIRVRIGIHSGSLSRSSGATDEIYVGLDVHRAARLCEAGHGGQILVSETTRTLVEDRLPEGVGLLLLGKHQLRDLPSPELIFQVTAPDLRTDFRPLRAVDVRLSMLSQPRTTLIGREREIGLLRHMLSTDARLITLTGPAGTGKTRLAVAAAFRATDLFRDDICFVELAPIGDSELVASTIVRRLGLQESGATSLEETLIGYLRDRQSLLVLDNFEHLLAAAPLVADLLSACTKLKVLATSRARLQVSGEQEFAVPPLEVPSLDSLPSHEELERYPATALFAQRATAANPGFAVSRWNFELIARLCSRLDGLPLAIELAAARTALLSPQEILTRIEGAGTRESLDLLTNAMRDAPSRHRTLRDAIGWSYGLLNPSEQQLFRRLSAYVGGFLLEDVVEEEGPAHLELQGGPFGRKVPLEIIDGVARLVSNSLVQRHERPDRPARFSLLETIREFGIEQLESAGELSKRRRRHATYFLALAGAGEREAGGPSQAEWLGRLDEEHPNLRAALAWSLGAGGDDAVTGAKLAATLWVFWFRRAYLREGSRWIQQAYAVCPEADLLLRARLLTGDGSLARMLGDFKRSETLLEASVAMWRELNDAEGLAWALSHLGLVKQWLGDLNHGIDLLEESLSLRMPSGDDRSIARSMFNLAVAEDFRQNYGRSAELYEATLEVQRRIGDIWGIGRVLGYLAKVILRRGELDRASALCEEALGLSTTVGDKWGIGLAQAGFGGVAWASGDLEKAKDWLRTSLLTFRDVGSRDRVAECLQDLASLSLRSGAAIRAVRLSASAEVLQKRNGLALWPAVSARRDEDMALAKARLGDARFAAEWAIGEATSLETAIDEATESARMARQSTRVESQSLLG